MQELAERCVLYCVCRKPYDEEVAMIACDRCGAWFHYGCMGLQEPRAATGKRAGAEVEVDLDFLCSDCTEAVARKRAAAAEKRRQQQERKAERARREEEERRQAGDGDEWGSSTNESGLVGSPQEAEAAEEGAGVPEETMSASVPAVPVGLKRKRSVPARRGRVAVVVSLLEGDPNEEGSEAESEKGSEHTEGGEEGPGRRPARRTAGVNHKYANGHYVLG